MTEIWPGLTFYMILWTILTARLTVDGAVVSSDVNRSSWLQFLLAT